MASKYDGDAVRLRLVVARLGRRLRAVDVSAGLTPSQASLLSRVVRRGPVGLSALAELEGVDAPSLSRAVDRLEAKKLVRRSPDPDDGRAVVAEATGAGRQLMDTLRSARNDALQARLAQLDVEERRLLHAALPVLEGLADALKGERARP